MNSNGYNPSIIHPGGECYLCHIGESYYKQLVRHEVFGGAHRQKSKRMGLWVNLCPNCHRSVHEHPKSMKAIGLKAAGEKAALTAYGWDTNDFIREFGVNWI